jgi:hypothetical protein
VWESQILYIKCKAKSSHGFAFSQQKWQHMNYIAYTHMCIATQVVHDACVHTIVVCPSFANLPGIMIFTFFEAISEARKSYLSWRVSHDIPTYIPQCLGKVNHIVMESVGLW